MSRKLKIAVFIAAVITVLMVGFAVCMNGQEPVLTNKNASAEAKAVFDYIASVEGNGVLTGQQESTWMGSCDYETDYIYEATGKFPVIKGFDYMNDDFDGVNERARQWWQKGGLVTICWHCGSDFSGEWKDCMEDEVADWEKMLTEGTEEYKKMLEGMDKAAKALKELQQENIPVLWRPFHEFDGSWFWWSKGGAGCFTRMWKIMYERYTNYWGLNNLIWVLGFSDQGEKSRKWYPGDDYCDIIGADTYQTDIYAKLYFKMKTITLAPKPLCLHECGDNPSVDELQKYPWCWFMTWHTEYLTDRNTPEELSELYNDDFVFTLDEFGITDKKFVKQ